MIHGYAPADVTVGRTAPDSDDAVLTFAGTEDRITIRNTLDGSYYDTVERIEFDDGTVWTPGNLRTSLLTGGDGDDILHGFDNGNTITGGGGDDTLYGGDGSDTYVFNRGDGADSIEDNGFADTDRLVIRGGGSDDTLEHARRVARRIEFDDGSVWTTPMLTGGDVHRGDLWRRRRRFDRGQRFRGYRPAGDPRLCARRCDGGPDCARQRRCGAHLRRHRGPDHHLERTLDGSYYDTVERIEFDDGTVWTPGNLRTSLLTGGDGDDILHGFDNGNTITGGGGNDTLYGGDGSDTYVFNRGDGADSIEDNGFNGYRPAGDPRLCARRCDGGPDCARQRRCGAHLRRHRGPDHHRNTLGS